MALTRERRIAVYFLVVVAMLALVGGSMIQPVEAKGRTKTKTTLTIRQRVDIQTDNCEIAGGEISVSYGYEEDGSESATTSCSGGLLDGNVCINEETTIECYQAGRTAPTGHLGDTIPLVPITDAQVVQPTPMPGVTVQGISTAPLVVSDGDVTPDDGQRVLPHPSEGSVLTVPVVDQTATARDDSSSPILVPLD